MIIEKIKKNKGFVILFAVTISAILLSIALGIAKVALNEIKFSTSGKDTNDAFFAADTGIEQVLLWDKANVCPSPPPQGLPNTCTYAFTNLGSSGSNCAIVTLTKENNTPPLYTNIKTTIVSKGYNLGDAGCTSSSPNRIERELDVTYNSVNTGPTYSSRFTVDTNSTLKNGLFSYWKLDGNGTDSFGGNSLLDGNVSSPVTYITGQQALSGQFAGAQDLVIADNPTISTGDIDFTVAGWVYFNSVATNQVILSKRDTTAKEFTLMYNNTTGQYFEARTYYNAGAYTVAVQATNAGHPVAGQWYFVVMWRNKNDNGSKTLNIQVNNGPINSIVEGGAPEDTTASFRIGAYGSSPDNTFFNGRIDEVGFWKKVLTDTERSDLYNASGNPKGNTYNP